MKKVFLLMGSCLLLCSGCIFFQNSYREPQDCDLPPAKPLPVKGCSLKFDVLHNYSGGDRRIMMRQKNGTFRRNEYQRWVVDPELLIRRFFYEAMETEPAALPLVRISGDLYRFEFIQEPMQARLLAGFMLTCGKEKRMIRCDYTIPFDEKIYATPGDAMGDCLSRVCGDIRQAAEEMVRQGELK